MKSYLLVEVSHTAPIPELVDLVAGRCWTMDKVREASAMLITSSVSLQIAKAQVEDSHG